MPATYEEPTTDVYVKEDIYGWSITPILNGWLMPGQSLRIGNKDEADEACSRIKKILEFAYSRGYCHGRSDTQKEIKDAIGL